MAKDIRDGEGEAHGATSGTKGTEQGVSKSERGSTEHEGAKMEMHHHVHHHHHEAAHHEHHHGGKAGEEAEPVKKSMGEKMYDKKKPERKPMAANEGM